jgi:hypothetical protein
MPICQWAERTRDSSYYYYQFVLSLLVAGASRVMIICPIPVAGNSSSVWLHPYRSLPRGNLDAQLKQPEQEKKPNIRPPVMPMDSSYYYYLLPICIESTGGRWGKACDDFFKKVMKANSKGNESVCRFMFIVIVIEHREAYYSNYWLSRLSCCLQKSIAASIVNRSKSKLINGDIL